MERAASAFSLFFFFFNKKGRLNSFTFKRIVLMGETQILTQVLVCFYKGLTNYMKDPCYAMIELTLEMTQPSSTTQTFWEKTVTNPVHWYKWKSTGHDFVSLVFRGCELFKSQRLMVKHFLWPMGWSLNARVQNLAFSTFLTMRPPPYPSQFQLLASAESGGCCVYGKWVPVRPWAV